MDESAREADTSSGSRHPAWRWVWLLAVAVAAAVAVAEANALFRFYLTQSRLPLWDMAGHGWGGVELLRALRGGHLLDFLDLLNRQDKWPFGYSLLLLPFLAAGNSTFASATLLSTALFALVPPLLLWVAHEVDDGAAGLWGGSLAATLFLASPLHRVFAILVMRETAGAAFSLLALALYLRARRLGTATAWRLAGIATLALLLIKYNYALVWLAALLLHELWRLPAGRRRLLAAEALRWLRGLRGRPARLAAAAYVGVLLAALAVGVNPGVGVYAGLLVATVVVAVRWRRDNQVWRARWHSLSLPARAALATVVLPLWVWCLSPNPIHPRSIIGFLRNRSSGPPLLSLESLTYYGRALASHYAAAPAVGVVLCVLPLLALARLPREREGWRLLLLLGGLGLALATLHPFKEARFLAVTAPVLMLATGLTVARAAHGEGSQRALRGVLAAVACAALLAGLATVALRAGLDRRLAGDYKRYSGRPAFGRVLTFVEKAAAGSGRVAVVGGFNELSGDMLRWWLASHAETAAVTVVTDPPRLRSAAARDQARERIRAWLDRHRPQRIVAIRLLPSSRLFAGADFQRYNAGGLAAVAELESDPAWQVARSRLFKALDLEVEILLPAGRGRGHDPNRR